MNLKTTFRRLFPEKSQIDFPGAYVPTYYIRRGAEGLAGRAVVIGDLLGRDYNLLTEMFEDVKAIDLVDNKVIPRRDLILQDASKETPFEANSVDYVVACNIIEHMFGDFDCVVEVNRILKPGGRFFVDVPYLADKPYFHYRVFTPKIIRRMMELAGFTVLNEGYRGFVFILGNNAFAAGAILLYPFFGRRALIKANNLVLWCQKRLDRCQMANRLVSDHFGGYILCEKTGVPRDAADTQIQHFGLLLEPSRQDVQAKAPTTL